MNGWGNLNRTAPGLVEGEFSRDWLVLGLYEMARCPGIWTTVDRGGLTPNAHAGAEREAQVAARLAIGYPKLVDLMAAPDATVRSLASLLAALCVTDPASTAQLLATQAEQEADILVRGSHCRPCSLLCRARRARVATRNSCGTSACALSRQVLRTAAD